MTPEELRFATDLAHEANRIVMTALGTIYTDERRQISTTIAEILSLIGIGQFTIDTSRVDNNLTRAVNAFNELADRAEVTLLPSRLTENLGYYRFDGPYPNCKTDYQTKLIDLKELVESVTAKLKPKVDSLDELRAQKEKLYDVLAEKSNILDSTLTRTYDERGIFFRAVSHLAKVESFLRSEPSDPDARRLISETNVFLNYIWTTSPIKIAKERAETLIQILYRLSDERRFDNLEEYRELRDRFDATDDKDGLSPEEAQARLLARKSIESLRAYLELHAARLEFRRRLHDFSYDVGKKVEKANEISRLSYEAIRFKYNGETFQGYDCRSSSSPEAQWKIYRLKYAEVAKWLKSSLLDAMDFESICSMEELEKAKAKLEKLEHEYGFFLRTTVLCDL